MKFIVSKFILAFIVLSFNLIIFLSQFTYPFAYISSLKL